MCFVRGSDLLSYLFSGLAEANSLCEPRQQRIIGDHHLGSGDVEEAGDLLGAEDGADRHQGHADAEGAQQQRPKLGAVGNQGRDPVPWLEAGGQKLGAKPLGHGLDIGVGESLAGEGTLQGGVGGVLVKPGHAVVCCILPRDRQRFICGLVHPFMLCGEGYSL